jgi:DNA-directed RNA polymerase subunit RPC12/RpoP
MAIINFLTHIYKCMKFSYIAEFDRPQAGFKCPHCGYAMIYQGKKP